MKQKWILIIKDTFLKKVLIHDTVLTSHELTVGVFHVMTWNNPADWTEWSDEAPLEEDMLQFKDVLIVWVHFICLWHK